MLNIRDDWEFNVLGIYNYRKAGPFDALFDFIRENHDKIPGDIVDLCPFPTTDGTNQVTVLVKTKDGKFMKHHLGLSDNVTYFSEQLKTENVSSDQYRVIFKPKALLPTMELDKADE